MVRFLAAVAFLVALMVPVTRDALTDGLWAVSHAAAGLFVDEVMGDLVPTPTPTPTDTPSP